MKDGGVGEFGCQRSLRLSSSAPSCTPPIDPIEGTMPLNASSSVNVTAVCCDPASECARG